MDGTTNGDDSDRVTIDELANRIEDIRSHVDAELDALKADVESLPEAHKTGGSTDALDVGDTHTAVVEDDGSGTKHGDPMTRIKGVVTFLKSSNDQDVDVGDTVEAAITAVEGNHAKGVITETDLDGGARGGVDA